MAPPLALAFGAGSVSVFVFDEPYVVPDVCAYSFPQHKRTHIRIYTHTLIVMSLNTNSHFSSAC